ncbi:MAG: sulfotransferase [Pseudomonadota bacterium]|nr:sulfotransferase [Sphingomonas sp.]MDQ3479068.1 sulfotransferase [Pseudomonadota bacterium]
MSAAPSAGVAGRPYRDRIVRPVLIVSTPRSGSTLLFETLVKAPGLFSAGGESHARIEQAADFFPGSRGWSSNRLDAGDARPETVEELARSFYAVLRDRDGASAARDARMLEKTPKNALRVPFFDAAWPDSLFIYLYRDVRQTLASMMEAWASGRFVTYPALPGWRGLPWSLVLTPGWQELSGLDLPEIVARQWTATTNILVDDLSALPPERVIGVDYGELLADPQATMIRLSGTLGLEWDTQLPATLPYSKTTYSRPSPDKWQRLKPQIESMIPIVAAADAKARAFLEKIRR